jgi:hypothetical protein
VDAFREDDGHASPRASGRHRRGRIFFGMRPRATLRWTRSAPFVVFIRRGRTMSSNVRHRSGTRMPDGQKHSPPPKVSQRESAAVIAAPSAAEAARECRMARNIRLHRRCLSESAAVIAAPSVAERPGLQTTTCFAGERPPPPSGPVVHEGRRPIGLGQTGIGAPLEIQRSPPDDSAFRATPMASIQIVRTSPNCVS